MNPRAIWLIAKSVMLEAVRRREIYAIVLISCLIIGAVMMIDFFQIEGLTKFYREIALKIMSIATGLTVVVLASRQLPREFESRTIYPLMARPVTRFAFLLGKLFGVMLSAAFCFALFMGVFICGTFYLGGEIPWMIFAQYVYLQLMMMLILATLSFWFSMMMNFDAAITMGAIFFLTASTFINIVTYIYDYTTQIGQMVLRALVFVIPQLSLFDLSEKAVHAQAWEPLGLATMASLTLYAVFFAAIFISLANFWFRRREL